MTSDTTTHSDTPASVVCLQPWIDAGVFDTTSVEITAGVLALAAGALAVGAGALAVAVADGPEHDHPIADEVILALALAVRAPLQGSVCADLTTPPPTADDGPLWPTPTTWLESVAASPLSQQPMVTNSPEPTLGPTTTPPAPLVLDDTRVYLHRSWHEELAIAGRLRDLASTSHTPRDGAGGGARLQALRADASLTDAQRQAIDVALHRNLTVLAGGPGTGKTHTVARMLAALIITSGDHPPVVELAAPTGKAAARLAESIASAAAGLGDDPDLQPVAEALTGYRPRTLHRLLGSRGRSGFTHDARNPLTADVVVVDEASMVSAHLMARLLDALRPGARLVLVGDPDQLTSVEAGAVMADVVRSTAIAAGGTAPDPDLAASVVHLVGSHRFGPESGIGQLADAIRRGDPDTVIELLQSGAGSPGELTWLADGPEADNDVLGAVANHARTLGDHARTGDAAGAVAQLGHLAVLCANRAGPHGVAAWNNWTEAALDGDALPATPPTSWARRQASGRRRAMWYPGRPVMVTANDYVNGLFNGDVGVVLRHDGSRQVAFADDQGGIRLVDPGRLGSVTTMWATTIHKSQGSEYDRVVVVLPEKASSLLTRQLLYTAVTRARHQVTVVGSADIVRSAVTTEVGRATGLTDRLGNTNHK